MAVLKTGSTVAGNLILHQGILPLYPSGDSLYHKNFLIFTKNDRPTNVDVGLSNVTNDAQVKKAGDTMTGNLTISAGAESRIQLANVGARAIGSNSLTLYANKESIFFRPNGSSDTSNQVTIDAAGTVSANKYLSVAPQASDATALTRKDYVDAAIQRIDLDIGTKVAKAGDTMTGNLNAPKFLITTAQGTEANAATRKDYVDQRVLKSGDTMTGRLNLNGAFSTNDVPNGNTYHWSAWKTSSSESKTYLRGFRSWAGATMWHETVEGGVYRLATGVSDTLEVLKLDHDALVLNGEIRPKKWDNLDARFLNTAGDTATGEMTFNDKVNLKKELYFHPTDNRSKEIFYIQNWGDGNTAGRSAVWELKDSVGYHFYTQRRSSDNQIQMQFSGNVAIGSALLVTGSSKFDGNINAATKELQVGHIILERTANNVARTRIAQWSETTGTNHRFEIYSQGTAAPFQRKNLITADVSNANDPSASAVITLEGEVRTQSLIPRGNIIMDSGRPYIHLKGLPAGSGAFVDQGNDFSFGGIFNEIDDPSGSVYSPMVKQRYKQGNLTWSQGTLYGAGDWIFHMKSDKGANAADRTWTFRKTGEFYAPSHLRAGSAIFENTGNINLPADKDGFSAGWLLGQINNRINDAVNRANNAQTTANAAKTRTKAWTQVWSGNAGGGATVTLSQDVRFRSIWIRSNGYYNPIKIGEDGLYFLSSEGGWIKFRISGGGRTFKNEQDERSVPTNIYVENE